MLASAAIRWILYVIHSKSRGMEHFLTMYVQQITMIVADHGWSYYFLFHSCAKTTVPLTNVEGGTTAQVRPGWAKISHIMYLTDAGRLVACERRHSCACRSSCRAPSGGRCRSDTLPRPRSGGWQASSCSAPVHQAPQMLSQQHRTAWLQGRKRQGQCCCNKYLSLYCSGFLLYAKSSAHVYKLVCTSAVVHIKNRNIHKISQPQGGQWRILNNQHQKVH